MVVHVWQGENVLLESTKQINMKQAKGHAVGSFWGYIMYFMQSKYYLSCQVFYAVKRLSKLSVGTYRKLEPSLCKLDYKHTIVGA